MENKSSYQKMLLSYGTHNSIPYADLLNCIEWHQKRLLIISRDNTKCRSCDKVGADSIFSPGSPIIHFYEDLEEVEYEDVCGIPRLGVKKVLKRVEKPVVLHVHHTYYAFDRKPWDYPDNSLITLCGVCHFELHKTTQIQWLDLDNKFRYLTPCPRCNGAGRFPEYSHVQGGTCFYCKGNMYIELMRR